MKNKRFARGVCGEKSALQTLIHVRSYEERQSAKVPYEYITFMHEKAMCDWVRSQESTIQWSGKCQYASDKHEKKPVCKNYIQVFFFLPRSTSELNIHFSCLFSLFSSLLFCQLAHELPRVVNKLNINIAIKKMANRFIKWKALLSLQVRVWKEQKKVTAPTAHSLLFWFA